MFRHDSKFVDPNFYVDPLAKEFTGVECHIRWCQIFGTCGNEDAAKAAQEAAARAQREEAAARAEAERQIREQQEALAREQARQEAERAAAQAELQVAETQAQIAAKKSAATSGLVKSRAQLEQAKLQQSAAATAMSIQQKQRQAAGATVGQPGRSKTQVTSRLGVGGYGGTSPVKVSSTGLNI